MNKNTKNLLTRFLWTLLFFFCSIQVNLSAPSTTLLDLSFNDGRSTAELGISTYQATGVVFSAAVTNESSLRFSTPNPATNGYLLFTANTTAANLGPTAPNWGGWWSGANLATIQSQYTNGGLGVPLLASGLPDPSQVSLYALS